MTDEEIEKIKTKHIDSNIEIYNKNKELMSLYNEYINKLTQLFDFLKKNNSDFFYTIVFDILMEVGFFSAGHLFDSNLDSFKEISIKPGISVVSGSGVCRNIACFYEDVFKKLYNYPLKICCLDKHEEKNSDTKIYGNHVINLTLHEEVIYGFDIMNHCVFKTIDKEKLQLIDNDYFLTYMPAGDLLLKLTTSLELSGDLYDEIDKTRELLSINAKQKAIEKDEYEKLILEANEFIMQRKKLFQSFMLENSELTYEIKKKMLSLK